MTRPAAILLAAGGGHRLGRDKQKLPWKGTSLLRHLAAELAAIASPLLVALPAGRRDLARELDGLAAETVFPPSVETGIAGSLSLAARALLARHGIEGVLVALVDQPLASRDLFTELDRAARGGSGWAACDYGEGGWGVPARFPATALPELVKLTGDRGARPLLEAARVRGELALVPFPGGRFDVDTEEDYARLVELAGDAEPGGGGSAG